MLYYKFVDGQYLVVNNDGELIDSFNTYKSMKEEYPEIEEF